MATEITYNGTTITSLAGGQAATLSCAGKKAKSNIAVAFDSAGKVTYNGVETAVLSGKTATLSCGGKKMKTDVNVTVAAPSYTHALYNGVKLPVIPQEVLKQYPYAWIRNNTSAAQYQLILAAYPWYYNKDHMYCSGGEDKTESIYIISISSALTATQWTFSKDVIGKFGAEITRPVMWTNHDIPNGSATATEIYFWKTEPVPIL